jgi:hypothetical protein
MEREFTNVSYAKPLWNYAISVYSENKTEFLRYQDQHGLCVNDLIVLGFCQTAQLAPTNDWWCGENTVNLRNIIAQLRSMRKREHASTVRATTLNIELACEKMDLNLIANQLQSNNDDRGYFNHYCRAHSIADKEQLTVFINSLDNKKGAEAPSLNRLNR